jgi:hypothetical protein
MTLDLTASGTELWRKYNTDGVSGSGLHSPELNDIQRWAGEVEAIVDLGFGIAVVTRTLSTPPASPATGAIYIVGSSPAGDWSTFAEDDLAQWSGSAWSNRTPDVGNEVYVIDEGLRCTFSSAGWSNNAGVRKKNYILNGAMMVSQENGTTAGTVTGYYPVDQFSISFSNAGAVSVAQVASATPGGSPNRLRVTVTTADASVAAGDFCNIIQKIEGLRAADLRLGSSAAKTVTLRFGVKAPAGTYCIGLRNSASNRSYVAEFTISAGEANTDVVKSVTVALDQSGTWLKDNGIGLEITFNLMVGSTYQTAAGVWTAGSFTASSNQFNFMGTLSNVFELFDVGLYDGASPEFQVPDYAAELLACARYFYATSARPGWSACRPTTFASRLQAGAAENCTHADPLADQRFLYKRRLADFGAMGAAGAASRQRQQDRHGRVHDVLLCRARRRLDYRLHRDIQPGLYGYNHRL